MANDILVTIESLKGILPLLEEKILSQVKTESDIVEEPLQDDLPSVFITGAIPESKDYVAGELEYISKTDRFHAYTSIKLQGNSTLALPKQNFTINLYEDESRGKKLNKNFKNWGAHNNFVLKADYNDILHARNVVCAKLWSKVVASRPDYDNLPKELRNSPNNGAIDGFPVKVYINGMYQGLYCWTIPKCDWMFGMNKSNENHAVLSAEINDNGDPTYEFNPCNFSTFWDGSEDTFEVEVGTNSDTMVSSLNIVIQAVIDGDLTTFEQVLDVQSVIDYYIFQDIILGIDGLAKNMLLVTYDMNKWYLSAYDMDSTFDMHWEGYLMNWYDAYMPDEPYLNRYNALPIFILYYYWDEYVARYWELRNSVLSEASIISAFEEFVNIYGEDIYIQDTVPYPDIPEVTTNTLDYLRNFVINRLQFLDNVYMIEEVSE
jgi:hypothetical protein